MGKKSNTHRGGSVKGLWGWAVPKENKSQPEFSFKEFSRDQPHFRYCAHEDRLFPGTWLAEPTGYVGRGVIYIFHGDDAEVHAKAWAKQMNVCRGESLNEIARLGKSPG
jgi:hypothetical protein